jgi:hypothetical protein
VSTREAERRWRIARDRARRSPSATNVDRADRARSAYQAARVAERHADRRRRRVARQRRGRRRRLPRPVREVAVPVAVLAFAIAGVWLAAHVAGVSS